MKKKALLSFLLVLTLLLCLLPATALAAHGDKSEDEEAQETEEVLDEETPDEAEDAEAAEDEDAGAAEEAEAPIEDEEEALPEAESVTVAEDEEFFSAEADTVYNNGGTVYNNGGLVYNNGGTVYNNGGLVYNNGGTVYSNGGTVYNNNGAVYNNGATVYCFAGTVEDSVIYGYHRVTLAADYSVFALIEGLEEQEDGSLLISDDAVCTVTPKEGYRILSADADAGVLTEGEEGEVLLSEVDGNLTLTLTFQAEAPTFSLESGTYAEAQTLELTAPEGAEIYYTLDGSDPGEENSLLYEEPISVEEGVTVTAVSVAVGAEISDPAVAAYAIPQLTAPKFETVEEGYTRPAAQGITVENPGTADAVIVSVELTGEDAESFTLNRSAGGTVLAGKTESTRWTIRPAADLEPGSYSALLLFTYDSGDTAELKISFKVK